jgi:FkbM family methyltransferase
LFFSHWAGSAMNEATFNTGKFRNEKDLPLLLSLTRWFGHQHWIPHGRERILRLLYHPDANLDFAFEVPYHGLRYRGNLCNLIDWSVFFYGEYARVELHAMQCAARLLRQFSSKIVYVDVGANVGQHLLFMTTIADELHEFEPYRPALIQAREKLSINAIDWVHLYGVALGDADEMKPFFAPMTNNPSGTLVAGYSENTAHAGEYADVRNGAEFFRQNQIDHTGIIKIDVDGFELEVCRGLSAIFRRDRPFILLELSYQSIGSFGTERAFRDCLYPNCRILEFTGQRLRPFVFGHFDGTIELLVLPLETEAEFAALYHSWNFD